MRVKPEDESNLLHEMRKNVPFPRRPVAAVLPQTERREIRVPIDKFSRLVRVFFFSSSTMAFKLTAHSAFKCHGR